MCDFLRATIYAADPFALALAFHEFQDRSKSLSKLSEREPSHASSTCPEEALQDRAREEQVCEREAENGGRPSSDRVAGHRVPLFLEERTNILVNFWVETEDMKQIGEVQFLMQEYLTATGLHRRDASVLT